MKLRTLRADRYRSLRGGEIELGGLNLFIGFNASGKSTILDALRFLSEGVRSRDFRAPVNTRGGIVHLAWKGEDAGKVGLSVILEGEDACYEWSLRLLRYGYEFQIEEDVHVRRPQSPPAHVLESRNGDGWWLSGEKEKTVTLKQAPTSCALASASADAYFPARNVADFVGRWSFFDPNPFLLRHDWSGLESGRFDPYGRNLAETLYALDESSRERVINATRAIVGLPETIEPRTSQDGDRFYFVQSEPDLRYNVHQMGASSGTLRMLALMTALVAEPKTNLIGIEEPENNIHPAALSSLMEYLRRAQNRVQIIVTTHSPLLLDFLGEPAAVRVVRRDGAGGTVVDSGDPEGVRRALSESGFGLGEYYETTGFGSD